MTDVIVVLVTAPNEAEAEKIAKTITDERLAGCVNIIRGIRSIYRWQGKIEDEAEVLMVVKSRGILFPKLRRRVKELHSYTVPEILALPVADGLDEYLAWLQEETA